MERFERIEAGTRRIVKEVGVSHFTVDDDNPGISKKEPDHSRVDRPSDPLIHAEPLRVVRLGRREPSIPFGQPEQPLQTIRGFSGSDVTVSFTYNGSQVQDGTITGISFENRLLGSGPLIVTRGSIIGVCVGETRAFSNLRELIGSPLTGRGEFDMILDMANEHGNPRHITIRDMRILSEGSGISVDDIVMETVLSYEALEIIHQIRNG